MKKLVTSLALLHFLTLFSVMANAEQSKPHVTILHSGSTSNSGETFSYPSGTPKLTIAQLIFPVGAQILMHTHPAPLIVHIISGEITSELVPVPAVNNPSAGERIRRELQHHGELSVTDLKIAVIDAARASGDRPVTDTAFTTALSREKQRGGITESGGKLRISGSLYL